MKNVKEKVVQMDESKKVARYYVTESNHEVTMYNIISSINSLLPKPVKVTVQQQKESRNESQNRLVWKWVNQLAKHEGYKPDKMFSILKMDLLLPIKLSHNETHDRGMYEQIVLDTCGETLKLYSTQHKQEILSEYEYKLIVAYDIIRSRNVPVKIFSEWLDSIKERASEQGVYLKSFEEY